jgi:hypothetical protein
VLVVASSDEGVSHSCLDKCNELLKPPTLHPLATVIPYFLLLLLGGMTSIKPFMIHVFQALGMQDEASWTTVSKQWGEITATCALGKSERQTVSSTVMY